MLYKFGRHNSDIVRGRNMTFGIKTGSTDLLTPYRKHALGDIDTRNPAASRELACNLYCKIGVAECWVLDWRNKQVDIYGLKNGVELRCTVTDQNKEELQMISFPEWKIAFDELFDFE